MSWKERRLGDVLTLKRGYDLPEAQRRPGDVPVISSSGITGSHNMAMVAGPGVVTGRYGTMGEVFYVEGDYWPHNTALYVRDFKGNNPRFIAYFLKNALRGTNSNKAAVPGVNRNDLHERKVCSPDLETQGRIVEQLLPIDDLIENNRRRIALLEQSARLLYREWFVHLRFPGHEHVKVVDGVPEGWDLCSAFDAMEVMSGGTPKTDVADYWHGEIPFFTPKDAVDAPYVLDTEKHLTDRGLAACNSQLYPKGTIFITARGTVGNLNLAQAPMAMNQSCYALKGKGDLSQFFLFSALKEAVQQFKSRAGGAVFDAIVVNTFKIIPFLRPPQELVREYTELVDPMFHQIDCLLLQSAKLREARDLLLPRLMSGDLVV